MRILLSHGLASSQVVFLQYYCFLLVAKSGDSLKKQTEKTDRVNSFLKKKKSISDMLELKAKYIKVKYIEIYQCNFIKKEYKYIYIYTRQSSTTPHKTFLFLLIGFKNYISYPKTSTNQVQQP